MWVIPGYVSFLPATSYSECTVVLGLYAVPDIAAVATIRFSSSSCGYLCGLLAFLEPNLLERAATNPP
jgi:hypothetical protein